MKPPSSKLSQTIQPEQTGVEDGANSHGRKMQIKRSRNCHVFSFHALSVMADRSIVSRFVPAQMKL
jgi:hypothetical protein